jgi:hypothetical protein
MYPLIMRFAVSRTDSEEVLYKYDYSRNLSVVKTKTGDTPFIDLNSQAELVTKTEVKRERDDEERRGILELDTKTKIQRERDDKNIGFLELTTKTDVKRERDDDERTLTSMNSEV